MDEAAVRERDIQHGLRLILDLGEVMEEEASGRTREIYGEVRDRLRVPLVNFLFRVLANYPAYLDLSWGTLAPHLLTREFERSADELRSLALPKRPPESPELPDPDHLDGIQDFTDTIFYVLPKLLLLASAWDEGLASSNGRTVNIPENPEEAIQPGVAAGTASLPLISPGSAGHRVDAIFEDIRGRHGHPGVPSYYRGIAQRPDFLDAAWSAVAPLVHSPSYDESKNKLLQAARQATGRLPLVGRDVVVEAGVDETRIEQLRAVLAVFRFRVIPDTFIEVALIETLLNGQQAARSSRFSFAAG